MEARAKRFPTQLRMQPKIINENGSKVLKCMNPDCKAKLLSKFVNFVSRDAMNIQGLSEATLKRFIDLGWLVCNRNRSLIRRGRIYLDFPSILCNGFDNRIFRCTRNRIGNRFALSSIENGYIGRIECNCKL